jgi:phosphoribosylamine--glycine ligase
LGVGNLKVLVIGGGAREHAICEIVKKSKDIELYSVMSNKNPGIQYLSKDYLIEKEISINKIVEYAIDKKIDMALIGPEAPLEYGLSNKLIYENISVCAPIKEAARIETDKEWMRNLLKKHEIPGQIKFKSFNDVSKAEIFIEDLNNEVVIKPIGLTGGKGVRVSGDHFFNTSEAIEYIKEIMANKIGGKSKVLIEEKAKGEEFTLQAFSDGLSIIPLPLVQDHKRLLPDDKGPNTGGMGSYSLSNGLLPFISKSIYEESAFILQKIIEALNKEKCKFIGPIYGQFMLTNEGPKIIEINARFGDPEAMNVLPLISSDFIDICNGMINENLCNEKIEIIKKSTVCKYVVPKGYGIKSIIDKKIILDEKNIENTGSKLYYASVNKKNDDIYTTSSRSLALVGISNSLENAETICENALKFIKGDNIYIRHDIGTSELINKKMSNIKNLNIV